MLQEMHTLGQCIRNLCSFVPNDMKDFFSQFSRPLAFTFVTFINGDVRGITKKSLSSLAATGKVNFWKLPKLLKFCWGQCHFQILFLYILMADVKKSCSLLFMTLKTISEVPSKCFPLKTVQSSTNATEYLFSDNFCT